MTTPASRDELIEVLARSLYERCNAESWDDAEHERRVIYREEIANHLLALEAAGVVPVPVAPTEEMMLEHEVYGLTRAIAASPYRKGRP